MRRPLALALLALLSLSSRPARAEDAPDDTEIRGYVGYTPELAQRIEPERRKELAIAATKGLIVVHVTANSPAQKAGLLVGDLVLELNGVAVPDGSAVGEKDDEGARKYMREQLRPLTSKVRPGDKVKLVVERAGKKLTFEPVAIDHPSMTALQQAEQEEELAVKVPAPKDRGAAVEASVDFEKVAEGDTLPADFLRVTGLFGVREEEGKAGNDVLVQDNDMGEDFAVVLLVADGRVYGDGKATVRWMPMGGEKSVSGGLVVRAQDRKNYVAIRADGVSKTLRVYVVRDGKAEVAASADYPSPKLNQWTPIEVEMKGASVSAKVGATVKVEAKEIPWASGWAGLATYGDAISAFDDWTLAPAK